MPVPASLAASSKLFASQSIKLQWPRPIVCRVCSESFVNLNSFHFKITLAICLFLQDGNAVAKLVEALCYKPECRGFKFPIRQ
jgi:hypothetical protein